jgi:hypothetical protein
VVQQPIALDLKGQLDVRSRREVEPTEQNLPTADHSHTQGKPDCYGGNDGTRASCLARWHSWRTGIQKPWATLGCLGSW